MPDPNTIDLDTRRQTMTNDNDLIDKILKQVENTICDTLPSTDDLGRYISDAEDSIKSAEEELETIDEMLETVQKNVMETVETQLVQFFEKANSNVPDTVKASLRVALQRLSNAHRTMNAEIDNLSSVMADCGIEVTLD